MAIPLIAAKFLPQLTKMAAGAMGKKGGKGGGSSAPVVSAPIMSGAEQIQIPDPFAAELSGGHLGLKRGKVTLQEEVPKEAPSAPAKEVAPKPAKPQKEGKGPSFKEVKSALGESLNAGLTEASEAMKANPPRTAPTILSKQAASKPLTGMTDAFDKLARQRHAVAKNLMG